MSVRELIPVLRPQKLESLLAKALLSVLAEAKMRALMDGKRIIRAYGFKAFFGGHLVAVAELKQRWEYGLGDYSMDTIQGQREKYSSDLADVLSKLDAEVITRDEAESRMKIIAQLVVWSLYNEGKLSTYRQRNEGKVGESPLFTAQFILPEFKFHAVWITQGDERVCGYCAGMDGKLFPLYGPLAVIPAHPFCRCEWGYEEALRS